MSLRNNAANPEIPLEEALNREINAIRDMYRVKVRRRAAVTYLAMGLAGVMAIANFGSIVRSICGIGSWYNEDMAGHKQTGIMGSYEWRGNSRNFVDTNQTEEAEAEELTSEQFRQLTGNRSDYEYKNIFKRAYEKAKTTIIDGDGEKLPLNSREIDKVAKKYSVPAEDLRMIMEVNRCYADIDMSCNAQHNRDHDVNVLDPFVLKNGSSMLWDVNLRENLVHGAKRYGALLEKHGG